eukprot:COSAG02_NODE_4754_length_5022_cov_2.228113_3_plen_74_part_00
MLLRSPTLLRRSRVVTARSLIQPVTQRSFQSSAEYLASLDTALPLCVCNSLSLLYAIQFPVAGTKNTPLSLST